MLTAKEFDRRWSLLGRNHAPATLFDAWYGGEIDTDVLARVLVGCWSAPEFPERFMDSEIWLELFDAAGYVDDHGAAARPDTAVTVYRGCTPPGQYGMSWTTDRAMAERFAVALRNREPGRIYTSTVEPVWLLGESHGRDEHEYVIHPVGLAPVEVM